MYNDWHLNAWIPRVERRTLPTYVADQLRNLIMGGILQPSQRLPSLRRLAAHLGISVPTVRQAMMALAYLGLVEIRHGVGCFVVQHPQAANSLGANLAGAHPAQLDALRRMLEPESAGLAAANADVVLAGDLRLLSYERERARLYSASEFIRADAAFHRRIVRAIDSPIIDDLHGRVIERLTDHALHGARQVAGRPELDEMHHHLAAAIGRGDQLAAVRLARAVVARDTQERAPPRQRRIQTDASGSV